MVGLGLIAQTFVLGRRWQALKSVLSGTMGHVSGGDKGEEESQPLKDPKSVDESEAGGVPEACVWGADDVKQFGSPPEVTTEDGRTILANQFELGKVIGEGSFGTVFMGRSLETAETVAVKREPAGKRAHLPAEVKFLSLLKGVAAVPSVRWYGVADGHEFQSQRYNYMVMDLLGLSLNDLLQSCGDRLSLKTVLMLSDQMIVRLEELHGLSIVHRDVKPENFAMGSGQSSRVVYLIDFGLSKSFVDPATQQHLEPRYVKGLAGTPRFASLRAHCAEQSRRDDLESLAYTLIYLLQGSLPWQGSQSEMRTETFTEVREKKQTLPVEELCKGCPAEICDFVKRCRSLGFKEPPNYSSYRSLFKNAMDVRGFTHDWAFDWTSATGGDNDPSPDAFSFDFNDNYGSC